MKKLLKELPKKMLTSSLLMLLSMSVHAKDNSISPSTCNLDVINNLPNSYAIWGASDIFRNQVRYFKERLVEKGYRPVAKHKIEESGLSLELSKLAYSSDLKALATYDADFKLSGEVSIQKEKTFIVGLSTKNWELHWDYLKWVLRKLPECE